MTTLILSLALLAPAQSCPGGQCSVPMYPGGAHPGFASPPAGYRVPPLTDPVYNPYLTPRQKAKARARVWYYARVRPMPRPAVVRPFRWGRGMP